MVLLKIIGVLSGATRGATCEGQRSAGAVISWSLSLSSHNQLTVQPVFGREAVRHCSSEGSPWWDLGRWRSQLAAGECLFINNGNTLCRRCHTGDYHTEIENKSSNVCYQNYQQSIKICPTISCIQSLNKVPIINLDNSLFKINRDINIFPHHT